MSLYIAGGGDGKKTDATSKEKFMDPCTVEEPNVSLADGVLGDDRRSVMSTCILLPSHDSSHRRAASTWIIHAREWQEGRVSGGVGKLSVAGENVREQGCGGGATVGWSLGPDVAKTPDDTTALGRTTAVLQQLVIDGFLSLTK